MSIARKIPATVITGFLGAGKTTLMRHLIEGAQGRRLALIVNEFGDLGIDGELLSDCGNPDCTEDDVFELANGCICCTVADDFLPTIQKILDRPDPPDHILIETSGLALPKPLVQAFAWPEVRTRVTVDGVITVVDAPAVGEGRFADNLDAVALQRALDENLDHDSPLEELFEDQLACADMVLLNKSDLMDEAALGKVGTELADRVRKGVKIVRTSHGRIDPAILLGLGAAAEDDLAARPSHHDDEPDHDHDDFDSFVLAMETVGDPEKLINRIIKAVETHDILRIKGFVDVAGRDMRMVLQGVGRRLQHYFDRDWEAGEARQTRLVVIGQQGMDRDAISAAIAG